MKTIILKKPNIKDPKTTELFGLSKSGKTTLFKKLTKNQKGISATEGFFLPKLSYLIKYFLKNPLKTTFLFYKLNANRINLNSLTLKNKIQIFKMRNFYLGAALSKNEFVKSLKTQCIIDEYLLQSIFMIKHKKSNKKEISRILKILPQSEKIILVESPEKIRYMRYKNNMPGKNINKDFAYEWIKNSEHNYKIIKKLLMSNLDSQTI